MGYYKYLLICSICVSNFFYFVCGSKLILRDTNNRDSDSESSEFDDMRIIAHGETPDFSREDLIEMIQKSHFFRDIFSEQPDPMTIKFGHACENPNEWEQRYEQMNFDNNHYQGKMRWGNKNGDYGEHYWDLGHTG